MRKSPIRHKVRTHKHKNKTVNSYIRGKGTKVTSLANPQIKHLKMIFEPDLRWAKATAERYNGVAKIVYMSPDEYLSKTPSTSSELISAARQNENDFSESSLKYLRSKAEKGEVFETPYLDYTNMFRGWASHEGRHRAFLAKKLGMSKIPVVVIKPQ